MRRELFHWKVDLQDQTGTTSQVDFFTYWNPLAPDAMEAVKLAAACTATAKSAPFGMPKVGHTAISAKLVTTDTTDTTD